MNSCTFLVFIAWSCISSSVRVLHIDQKMRIAKTNDVHEVDVNSSHMVADRASNTGCKCTSECGGEPQKWCRTEGNCGNPPSTMAMALGYWDWCDIPRAKEYGIDLTCNCVNRHSYGLIASAMGGPLHVSKSVTKELAGYWENLPKSKVGGLGGRDANACHALCPKMCCRQWLHDKEKKDVPIYDGYDKCSFDVVGQIGSKWYNTRGLSSHGALTEHEAGKYTHMQRSSRSNGPEYYPVTATDPEAACLSSGCAESLGHWTGVYIADCPANPRAKTKWGEVALLGAITVLDFITPRFQAPRLGLGNANPQMPNLGGMAAMGGFGGFGA